MTYCVNKIVDIDKGGDLYRACSYSCALEHGCEIKQIKHDEDIKER